MDIEQSFVSKVRVRKVMYKAQRKQILVTWYISPLREGLFKRWAKIPFSIFDPNFATTYFQNLS